MNLIIIEQKVNGGFLMDLEKALISIVRRHQKGIEAGDLRRQLEDRGFEAADVREAIRNLVDRGALRLGQELRLEARAA